MKKLFKKLISGGAICAALLVLSCNFNTVKADSKKELPSFHFRTSSGQVISVGEITEHSCDDGTIICIGDGYILDAKKIKHFDFENFVKYFISYIKSKSKATTIRLIICLDDRSKDFLSGEGFIKDVFNSLEIRLFDSALRIPFHNGKIYYNIIIDIVSMLN